MRNQLKITHPEVENICLSLALHQCSTPTSPPHPTASQVIEGTAWCQPSNKKLAGGNTNKISVEGFLLKMTGWTHTVPSPSPTKITIKRHKPIRISMKKGEVITAKKIKIRIQKADEKTVTDITEQRKLNPKLAFGESPKATQFIPLNLQKAWASLEIGRRTG